MEINRIKKEIEGIYNFIGEGIETPEKSQKKLKEVWIRLGKLKGDLKGGKNNMEQNIKKEFWDNVKKSIEEIENNSSEDLKQIYENYFLNGNYVIKKKNWGWRYKIVSNGKAEEILNRLHQDNNYRDTLKRQVKKMWGYSFEEFKKIIDCEKGGKK